MAKHFFLDKVVNIVGGSRSCDCYVVLQCLCNAIDFADPPMFHKLAYLNFEYGHHRLMENVLPLLLHQAPKLSVLIFYKVC